MNCECCGRWIARGWNGWFHCLNCQTMNRKK